VTAFEAFYYRKYEECHGSGYGSTEQKSSSNSHTYYSHLPNAGRRGKPLHATSSANYSTCAKEADASNYLSSNSSWVAIEEMRIGLRNPYREHHSYGRTDADERECAKSRIASTALAFKTNCHTEQQTYK
jgi:hypothetical protein